MSRIGFSPQSINGYINSESFQFWTLWELAMAHEYNFLADLTDNLLAKGVVNSQSKFQEIILAQAEESADLKKENAIFKELLKR